MNHEITLISLIAIGLTLALAGGLIAVRLRLPVVLGYMLAGVAIGPFTPGFVGDPGLAYQLAELGVIFLMFGVGMHFSIEELWAVRRIAVPGAVVQILVATAMGAGLAALWGWTLGAGLVFGLALSVASTVVVLKALEARQLVGTDDGHIAIGWLIVEDLVTVIALVFLPALGGTAEGGNAVTGSLWANLGIALGKVVVFIALMLIAGARIFPWLLRRVERTGSRDLFTLAVVSLSIGIAYASAMLFGVSFALGAFFAGMVLNASDSSRRAVLSLQPLEDVFTVLFFVSVGMLFDPAILVNQPLRVVAVLAIIVAGKSLTALVIVLALRHPVGTALTVAAALSQIGEFSFILAELGVSLRLLPEQGQRLIVVGALLSIALNPFAFHAGEKWMPAKSADQAHG